MDEALSKAVVSFKEWKQMPEIVLLTVQRKVHVRRQETSCLPHISTGKNNQPTYNTFILELWSSEL